MKKTTRPPQSHQNSSLKKRHQADPLRVGVEINQIIERVLSRRTFVRGGAAFGMAAMVSGGLPVAGARLYCAQPFVL